MSNKQIGNAFEKELCTTLAQNGFWAHNLAQNQDGQPFDVIACRNNAPYAFDCKVCEHNKFELKRIEMNQEEAMSMMIRCGNAHCYFALKLNDGSVYIVNFFTLLLHRDVYMMKSMNEEIIRSHCIPFEKWLETARAYDNSTH